MLCELAAVSSSLNIYVCAYGIHTHTWVRSRVHKCRRIHKTCMYAISLYDYFQTTYIKSRKWILDISTAARGNTQHVRTWTYTLTSRCSLIFDERIHLSPMGFFFSQSLGRPVCSYVMCMRWVRLWRYFLCEVDEWVRWKWEIAWLTLFRVFVATCVSHMYVLYIMWKMHNKAFEIQTALYSMAYLLLRKPRDERKDVAAYMRYIYGIVYVPYVCGVFPSLIFLLALQSFMFRHGYRFAFCIYVCLAVYLNT